MSDPSGFYINGQQVGREEYAAWQQGNYAGGRDKAEIQLQVIQSITLARIYDILLLIYAGLAGNDEMLKVAKAHEQGRFIGPDPAIAENSGDEQPAGSEGPNE